MDATQIGTYFPPKINAHETFYLTENNPFFDFIAKSEKSSALIYDYIQPEFTCNTFVWSGHEGQMKYQADILYNIKDDLKTGGRIYLRPMILEEPFEEIKDIFGCGASGGLKNLSMVNPRIHHNILYSLIGKNLEMTPYTYNINEEISCPAEEEEPITMDYYTNGVLINGANKGNLSEHFPDSDLFGAKFDYQIRVESATPLPR
jgi:hypothetical protein